MNTLNAGGPAFPTTIGEGGQRATFFGLSLRDYFAAHATEWDVQNAIEDLGGAHVYHQAKQAFRACRTGAERNAVARYFHADAMLQARQA